MISKFGALLLCVMASLGPEMAAGHGRMIEPASRNCMWRFNYKNPRNYNDMGLNCGGFTNQFEQQRGNCGVCGDPWQGPRDHEAGGKYARGLVARQYKMGAFINVTVELTSNHKGYFEFRLCPVNNPNKRATQACMDQNLLNIVGHGTRYFIRRSGASVYVELIVMLPPKLICSQCVIQWRWVAGQSMGPDGYGGECLGCGNQEHFVNCADIAIGTKAVSPLPLLPSDSKPVTTPPRTQANAAPAYNVINKPATTGNNNNNFDVNMASLMKQIYSSLAAAGGQTYQTQTTQAPWTQAPVAPSWNSQYQAPSQQASWQQNPLPNLMENTINWAGTANSQLTPVYPGYEHGEYPEVGEVPSTPGFGQGQTHNQYMQGYNDALRQMQDTFGGSRLNAKSSPAFNELSLSLQESQKGSYVGGSGKTCPDGAELECRASNQMFGSDFDSFCQNACSSGQQCPSNMCTCECPGGQSWSGSNSNTVANAAPGPNCRSIDRKKAGSMDRWCSLNCAKNNCPSNMCVCG